MPNENPEAGKHPNETHPITETPAPVETPTPDPAASAEPEVIYDGLGGKMTDPKQVAEYAKTLEKRLVQATAEQPRQVSEEPTAEPTPEPQNWVEQAKEHWYTDPDKAITVLRQGITGEVKAENAKKENSKKFWDNFYEKNPDLRNSPRAVNLVMSEKRADFEKLTVGQLTEKLAAETRSFIASVGGSTERTTRDLPQGEAVVTSSGGSNVGGGTGKVTPKPKRFIDQVKDFQAGKK